MVSAFLLVWVMTLCLGDGGEEWHGEEGEGIGYSDACRASFSQKQVLDVARDSENLRSIILRHNLRVRLLFCCRGCSWHL